MIERNKICDNPECEEIVSSAFLYKTFWLCESCASEAYKVSREELWKRAIKGSIFLWYEKKPIPHLHEIFIKE